VPNVEVLPAGDPEEELAAPVDRAKLRMLLAAAVARYDYVLVQVSSPLREPRTLLVAAEADAVFLLAEDNRTFMKTLDDCRKVLLSNGVKDVRVVVTGAAP
jgi:MinD-like ATPase involved in chromosome partitioning or flagellar assembly